MTDSSATIVTDVADSGFDGLGEDSGFDAFLANLTGEQKKAPPETDAEATDAAAPETGSTEETADADTEDDDPDEYEVEIKVGEETHKPKLKDLKRLFGQEAALTQKSQKV